MGKHNQEKRKMQSFTFYYGSHGNKHTVLSYNEKEALELLKKNHPNIYKHRVK